MHIPEDGDQYQVVASEYTGTDWSNDYGKHEPITVHRNMVGTVRLANFNRDQYCLEFGNHQGLQGLHRADLENPAIFTLVYTRPQWLRNGWCCAKAKGIDCVCAVSYECPVHAPTGRHVGTHD